MFWLAVFVLVMIGIFVAVFLSFLWYIGASPEPLSLEQFAEWERDCEASRKACEEAWRDD